MGLNINSSRMYVVEETTANTLKVPSAGSEAIALQTGFELSPNADTLQSDEIRASVGQTKPIVGIERPSGSFNHYLRHSAVEGAVPDFHLLLKSLFGSTTTNGTERTLTSSSTVSLLKLAAGGSDFPKGFAALIKDGTNGYSIRPSDGYSTNDVTLGFDLENAPASGVTLGKCINYTPVDEGHPTLSLWLYIANGGALEAMAGTRITGVEITANVGELINMAFTAGGTAFYFNPIVITANNKYIDVVDDGGTVEVSIPEKIYRTPLEVASALADALNAGSIDTWTVTYNSFGANAGKFTIASDGTTTQILWKTGTHGSDNTDTHIGTVLGFSDAADDTGANSYNSDNAQVWSDALTPDLDDSDPLVFKDNEVLIGDSDDYVNLCVQQMSINVNLEVADVLCSKATSGIDSKVIRRRTSAIQITAVLDQHNADTFDRFLNNTTTKFLANFGPKVGGNWVPGKCVSVYSPQATISAFTLGENEGTVTKVITITPYVDGSGNPEIYFNLV